LGAKGQRQRGGFPTHKKKERKREKERSKSESEKGGKGGARGGSPRPVCLLCTCSETDIANPARTLSEVRPRSRRPRVAACSRNMVHRLFPPPFLGGFCFLKEEDRGKRNGVPPRRKGGLNNLPPRFRSVSASSSREIERASKRAPPFFRPNSLASQEGPSLAPKRLSWEALRNHHQERGQAKAKDRSPSFLPSPPFGKKERGKESKSESEQNNDVIKKEGRAGDKVFLFLSLLPSRRPSITASYPLAAGQLSGR
jgi:hypothetical protein